MNINATKSVTLGPIVLTDVEGNRLETIPDGTNVEWTSNPTVGEFGDLTPSDDGLSATWNPGSAGSEGTISVKVTFPDGVEAAGSTENLVLVAGDASLVEIPINQS